MTQLFIRILVIALLFSSAYVAAEADLSIQTAIVYLKLD